MRPCRSPRKDSPAPRPNGTLVRRILVVLVAMLALPVVAAAQSLTVKPLVVVYPFTAQGSTIDKEASSRLATIIASQMANTKLVTVLPPPPGTERKDYLNAARELHADYYVSGFIAPLGSGVSVVEQVVSTGSGTVAYGTSVQLQTYADAAGQGDQLATLVAQLANRSLAAIPTAPPAAAAATPPPAEGGQANLGGLFRRKKTAQPAVAATAAPKPAATAAVTAVRNVTPPPATPAPAAATPAPAPAAGPARYEIVPVEGSASDALRALAAQHLTAAARGEAAPNAEDACRAHPDATILRGALSDKPDPAFGSVTAAFDLVAATCGGKTLWHKSFERSAGNAQLAAQLAAQAAIGAFLNPPPPRRR